jgi:D-alanine-D-alanine ligase
VKRKRVLVLIREGLEPPDSISGMSREELESAPWKTERDVILGLRDLGHMVQVLGVDDDLQVIRQAIEQFKPHIAFNLLEEFASSVLYDQNVVSYLEMMGMRYTGCNPRGLILSRDKAVSKKLLAYHRIRVPDFAVFPRGRRIRRPKKLRFPLFVKSVTEDASLGISQASLVKDDEALQKRVAFIHEHAGTAAIAEEFIHGRELYVGMLGNQRLEVLPVWELLLKNKPDHLPLIATAQAKWNLKYKKRWGVDSRKARDLPDELLSDINRRCRRIYRVLGLSGYARLDFRLEERGRLYFIEANANPQISRDEDFAQSASAKGLSYPELIERILSLGLRWRRE